MKYSAVIPAYNAETTIENTVESLRRSGLADYEILIIDDGSKDATPQICDRLAETYGELRCVHQKNAGVSAARNRGIQEAGGEYIWFFDADDYVDENSTGRMLEVMQEHAPDMLIFGLSFDFFKNGEMYERWDLVYDAEAAYTRDSIKRDFKKLYDSNALTTSCNKLIKRSVLIENGLGFDQNLFLMEDLLFSVNTIKKCDSIYVLPQTIYRYVYLEVKSVEDEPTTKRLNRIPRLSEYLKPFETALEDQPEVLAALFYMLLGQKLRTLKPAEIAVVADDFCAGPYSSGRLFELCPQGMKKTAMLLKKKKCFRIYLRQRKNRIRRKIITIIKRTAIYEIIKGRKR